MRRWLSHSLSSFFSNFRADDFFLVHSHRIESPDITPRATPAPTAAAVSKSTSRRAPAAKPEVIPANLPPLPHPDDAFIEGVELAEGEEGMDEDGDGQVYCYCHRVSFGEMIGCDGTECEREWVSPLHSFVLFPILLYSSFIGLAFHRENLFPRKRSTSNLRRFRTETNPSLPLCSSSISPV